MTTSAANTAPPGQVSCHNRHLRFFANSEMGPLKSFHKFFEGVRLSAPKKLDQKSAVAPPACCGCSLRRRRCPFPPRVVRRDARAALDAVPAVPGRAPEVRRRSRRSARAERPPTDGPPTGSVAGDREEGPNRRAHVPPIGLRRRCGAPDGWSEDARTRWRPSDRPSTDTARSLTDNIP